MKNRKSAGTALSRPLQGRIAAVAGLLVSLLVHCGVSAPASAPASNTVAKAVAKADAAPEVEERVVEQSIYIPYKKLWRTFEEKGRGVFLPYDEFMELWRKAESTKTRPPEAHPPVTTVVAEVAGEVTVSEDVVLVKADVRIELLKEGWHEIPLRLDDVAITSATLAGKPARLVRKAGKGYYLVTQKTGKEPEVLTLKLEFARSYAKAPGRNSVDFQCPVAPVSRWDVRVPEQGVKVDVEPMLATTDAPAAEGNITHVLAFVGATPTLRINWTPKAEGAKGLKALATVTAQHEVRIDEGVTRTRTRLSYDISRTELSQLMIEVPAGQKVVNVFDQNVREWSVTSTGGVQHIAVELFQSARETQALVVELETFGDAEQVQVPVVRALGVTRQQGAVVVKMGGGLRAETAERSGLLQVDAKDLPASLRSGKWDFSYQYAALPFSLSLNVGKVQPRILTDALSAVHLTPDEMVTDFMVVYDIQRAGLFKLDVRVPADFEVRDVRGLSHGKAFAAAAIATRHVGEAQDGMQPVTISLSRKAIGKVGLHLSLRRKLQAADLLTPTGRSVEIPVPLARAGTAAVEREKGRVIVYAPESLRVNPGETQGLRPVAFAEAEQGMPSVRRGGERPVLSFGHAGDAVAFSMAAERRAPHITSRQLLVGRIESGAVKYECTLTYDVLYSGVKSLRIDIPAALADKIRLMTGDLRRTVMTNPDGLEAGAAAWRIEGETEFMGKRVIRLRWEDKIPTLDIGKPVQFSVPRLAPREVDRAWGQIVLTKAESIDVAPGDDRSGLRPIDPRYDLMPDAKVKDAARAFEFHDDWQLSIRATRYEPKSVKATSIERGLVRMVVTRGDATGVQALYRMRSARQRLVVHLPGEVDFDARPVRINGRPVTLERGEPGEYFVPLVNQQQDEPFLLEMRYFIKGAGLTLRIPEFPKEPATQQVYLSAYVPRELTYLGYRGPWTDEMVWELRGFECRPRGARPAGNLLAWVQEGLSVDRGSVGDFATDGRHLLYSTLRPVAGKAGALGISAVRGWWFRLLLVVAGVALGVALLPASLRLRAYVVGAGIIVLILLAVFAPSTSRAVVNNATAGGGLVVLVLWGLWFLVVTLPRLNAARKAARNQPPPMPPPMPATADEPQVLKKVPESPPSPEQAEGPPDQSKEEPAEAEEAESTEGGTKDA